MATSKFDPTRSVEVIAKRYGTGYLIGSRLILTVAHIFDDDPIKCSVRSRVDSTKYWESKNSQVIWCNFAVDAALVLLPKKFSDVEAVSFGTFSPKDMGKKIKFVMYGWPEWAQTKKQQRCLAGGRQIEGHIWLADYSANRHLILEPERKGSQWTGMSGAAVFCRGVLVGIQVQHQRPDRNSSLAALPIKKLLCDDAFVSILNKHAISPKKNQISIDTKKENKTPKILPPISIGLIGRDKLVEEIKRELLQSNKYLPIILLQTPGVGKSELSYYLANDNEVLTLFQQGVLWATLGKKPDVTEELIKWSHYLNIPPQLFAKLQTNTERSNYIRSIVNNRNYLILLDDVWQGEHIKHLLVGDSHCATIVTTRRESVCEFLVGQLVQQVKRFILPPLSLDNGLALLQRLAPEAVQQDHKAAKELVRAVNALPMALVLMGKQLSTASHGKQRRAIKITLKKYKEVEKRLTLVGERKWYQPEDTPLSLEVSIKMSENELDSFTRQIFQIISIFRVHPNSFSLRAVALICKELNQFNKYSKLEDLEDVLYDSLYNKLSAEGLLEPIPDIEFETDDLDSDDDIWNCEQVSPKFSISQVIADYTQLQLSQEQKIKLHTSAANYYRSCLFNYEETGKQGEVSSYERMYAYENLKWQRVKASWLFHLSHIDPIYANLAFVRLYFDAFWWWGEYLEYRPFCEEILEEWRARSLSIKERKWLTFTENFHNAYPYGYDKRNRGDWQVVKKALFSLRDLCGINRDILILEEDEELRHIRVITSIYLAQAIQYQNIYDPLADTYYKDALSIIEQDLKKTDVECEDEWNIPWIKWLLGDLYLARGWYKEAQKLVTESRNLAFSSGENIVKQDLEIIANNYRVEGDIFWAKNNLERAFQNYTLALFFAWGFHAYPNTILDYYTLEFHKEMTERICKRLQELWKSGKHKEAKKACFFIRNFWCQYWQDRGIENSISNIPQLLRKKSWGELVTYLFPQAPTKEDIIEAGQSEYCQRILRIFPLMVELKINDTYKF